MIRNQDEMRATIATWSDERLDKVILATKQAASSDSNALQRIGKKMAERQIGGDIVSAAQKLLPMLEEIRNTRRLKNG